MKPTSKLIRPRCPKCSHHWIARVPAENKETICPRCGQVFYIRGAA